MKQQQFFTVFARLVEKVTREPVDGEVDFDWTGYFDSDMPEPSQRLCAELAANDYLKENGYRYSLDPVVVVESVMRDLVS